MLGTWCYNLRLMSLSAETIRTGSPIVDSGNASTEYEPSLRKSFEGLYLNKIQVLAVNTLDQFRKLSPSDRKTLFYYFLWHETGSFASIKQFGEIRKDSQIDSIINKVSDDNILTEAYGEFYSQYLESYSKSQQKPAKLLGKRQSLAEAAVETELSIDSAHAIGREIKVGELLKKSHVSDVLRLKKQGLSYARIMTILGISEFKVGIISSMLIAAGLIEPNPKGRVQVEKFEAKLPKILPLRGELNAPEIADKTGYSQGYVKSVFKRMRSAGQVRKLDKRKVVERTPSYKNKRYLEIREGVKRLRNVPKYKYTEQEIADILSKELGQDVTRLQVKRQIRMLLVDGEIKRRVN